MIALCINVTSYRVFSYLDNKQKENFSKLKGIIELIQQAATLNLPETEILRELVLKTIKDVVRRSLQNSARKNKAK